MHALTASLTWIRPPGLALTVRRWIGVLTWLVVGTSAHAQSLSLAQCSALANQLNQQMPMRADTVTSVQSVVCVQVSGVTRLTYLMEVDLPRSQIDQATLDSLRPKMLNAWCTDPQQRRLLNAVDVSYRYRDNAGHYIGVIQLSARSC